MAGAAFGPPPFAFLPYTGAMNGQPTAPSAAIFAEACAHHRAGRLAEAEQLYRAVLARDPAHADCLHRLGVLAHQCGDSTSGAALIRHAVVLDDSVAAFHNHLGVVLQAQGRHGEARESYVRALGLAPDLAEAHNNLGNLALDEGDAEQALSHFDEAARLAPELAEISYNRGNTLRALARMGEAEAAYRHAIVLQPDHAEAHVHLGLQLLAAGHFAEGGREYDWRWRLHPPPSPLRSFTAPEWQGENLAGTLLIHAEQGLGDTIQFCRFASMARERCAGIAIEVPPPLRRLLSPLESVGRMIARGEALPPVDAHCPLMSLPWRLGVTLEVLSPPTPYLAAEPARVARWQARLSELCPAGNLRVGIAWQGNPVASIDRGRSIPLSAFAPLATVPGVTLISLQKHHGLEQLAELPELVTFGEDLDAGPDAFIDTAAILHSLDLVIAGDSAVAHLAGALGRPVWLALQAQPEWRWQAAGTRWYPVMRLFRQSAPGDWPGLFARLTAELLALAQGWRRP